MRRKEDMMVEELPGTVKLHCPLLSKTVPFEAREEQRLDLGSIARAFGLEPWSVRLNGHFISRGIDLISSSVTWRSLLRFFSSKGLSTGKDDGEPLIVDGKLLMAGKKRPPDPEDSSANGNGRAHLEADAINLPHLKKLKCQGSKDGNFLWFKRKHLLEEANEKLPKRLRGNGNTNGFDKEASRFSCGFIGEKRQREDDTIAGASVKRVR